ncbi:predicted protein [Pyrenophora tritici-repentis Pt-1C-BFP]|uniref:Uncharacterized protein n=1 Tax=Pyrenophora tritici-repentis (strain Pt-1C-BFP) TaxID=426418 RepID=B2VY52_PYRTR|nr:uncharacterized protein PTRG_02342 [Pyrenophora tritici-repentis Pt-1C-BFP]EDU44865.1 predicted protein [Pyrenophora tritici-repentis Pt-1C-BFP]
MSMSNPVNTGAMGLASFFLCVGILYRASQYRRIVPVAPRHVHAAFSQKKMEIKAPLAYTPDHYRPVAGRKISPPTRQILGSARLGSATNACLGDPLKNQESGIMSFEKARKNNPILMRGTLGLPQGHDIEWLLQTRSAKAGTERRVKTRLAARMIMDDSGIFTEAPDDQRPAG